MLILGVLAVMGVGCAYQFAFRNGGQAAVMGAVGAALVALLLAAS
jgi:hypothetical protein